MKDNWWVGIDFAKLVACLVCYSVWVSVDWPLWGLGFCTGMGKPAGFPKQVMQVWVGVGFWYTTTYHIPVLWYHRYKWINYSRVSVIFPVLKLVFPNLFSFCHTVTHQIWLCELHIHSLHLTFNTTYSPKVSSSYNTNTLCFAGIFNSRR